MGKYAMPVELVSVDPKTLVLLEENARFMSHDQFSRLVANVKKDGALTSAPFVWKRPDGSMEVLSGNHRTRAAIDAGLQTIWVMMTDADLDESQRIAIQLSHNSIAGQDDPDTLRKLYDRIKDIDLRSYSGLDDKALGLLPEISIESLNDAGLDYRTITMMFLPREAERAKAAFAAARKSISGDEVWLAHIDQYEKALDMIDTAGMSIGVSNIALSLLAVLALAEKHVGELRDGFLDPESGEVLAERAVARTFVPVVVAVGSVNLPVEVAAVVQHAIRRAMRMHSLEEGWQGLEVVAAEALSGPAAEP